MKLKKHDDKIIGTLESGGFYAECPCCNKAVPLSKAGLFYLNDFTMEASEVYEQRQSELKERKKDMKQEIKSISEKSEIGARAVNLGFIFERIAPILPAFHLERNDCRSLFDPIDYVIFEGLSRYGRVSKIFFADIGFSQIQHS